MSGTHRTDSPRTLVLTRRGKLVAAVATVAVVAGGDARLLRAVPAAGAGVRPRARCRASGSRTRRPRSRPPTCPLTGLPTPRRRGPRPPGARGQGGERAGGAAAGRAERRRRRRRGAGRGRLHAVHRGLPVRRLRPRRPGSERAGRPIRTTSVSSGRAVFGYSGAATGVTAGSVPRARARRRELRRSPPTRTRGTSHARRRTTSTRRPRRSGRRRRRSRRPPDPLFAYAETWDGAAKTDRLRAPAVLRRLRRVLARGAAASARGCARTATSRTCSRTASASRPTNVVIQVVTVTNSGFLDAAGNPSPEVDLTGSGKAYVLRDGDGDPRPLGARRRSRT